VQFADGSRDALADDDRAYAYLPRRASLRVELVGKSTPLELVLQANPRYALTTPARPSGTADVTVLTGQLDGPPPPGRYLLIDARGPGAPVATGDTVTSPRITWWREEHPVLRGVVLSDLAIGEAPRLSLPATATPLFGSSETALAYALDDGMRRVVGLGFALERSNLPLRVGFPVLVYDAIDWLIAARGDAGQELVSDRPVELTDGAGKKRQLEPVGGRIDLRGLPPGFYSISRDGQVVRELAVSVADAGETRLKPVVNPVKAGAGRLRDTEAARSLLILALVLVLIEWRTYHRRKTV